MYMLTETSEFMMSFVIVTKKNNVIIVDGGRREDMPLLKKYVAGRHVSAWILTHAHSDHIDGFVYEMAENGGADFDIETVYYNFPDYDKLIAITDVPDLQYFREELNEMIPAFNAVKDKFIDKARIVEKHSFGKYLYFLHEQRFGRYTQKTVRYGSENRLFQH